MLISRSDQISKYRHNYKMFEAMTLLKKLPRVVTLSSIYTLTLLVNLCEFFPGKHTSLFNRWQYFYQKSLHPNTWTIYKYSFSFQIGQKIIYDLLYVFHFGLCVFHYYWQVFILFSLVNLLRGFSLSNTHTYTCLSYHFLFSLTTKTNNSLSWYF